MAVVTVRSDFGAQENKISQCFQFSSSICHEVMGPDAMTLDFWILSFKPGFSLSSFIFIKTLLVSLQFLPLEWYHLHIWGCWYFSWQSCFQHVIYPAQRFTWYTLHRNSISIGVSVLASVVPMNIQDWFLWNVCWIISPIIWYCSHTLVHGQHIFQNYLKTIS